MKPPAMESAVHTTPPIIMAAVMPLVPLNPALTSTSEVRMSVISVMPDTGLDPTMAMALAATVVKRNEMIKTSSSEMTVKSQLCNTPNWKKKSTATSTAISTDRMVFMGRSRSVRSRVSTFFLPLSSLTASPSA